MKFEERRLEKEDQQRREDRDFQLKMMTMMIQGPPPVPLYYSQQSRDPYLHGGYPAYSSGLNLDDTQHDEM